MNTPETDLLEKHILVVDDDVALANMIITILQRSGFKNVWKTESVPEAQKLIEDFRHKYSLVITDLQVGPQQSGLDVIATIRRLAPETKVILMTGCLDEKLLDIAHQSEPDGFLAKPFGIQEFMAELEKLNLLPEPAEKVA